MVLAKTCAAEGNPDMENAYGPFVLKPPPNKEPTDKKNNVKKYIQNSYNSHYEIVS